MSPQKKRAAAESSKTGARRVLDADVEEVVASLQRLANKRTREEMTARYGIPSHNAFGVPMASMQKVAKRLGRNHDLAAALWDTGWYEARTVAALIDEPERVTPAQMDRWARDFDSWAICDTACFKLFDRTPNALRKVEQWSRRSEELVKRAAFALLASVALHDKQADDETFARFLPLVESAAGDERNFVKKGVLWALRAIGGRSPALNAGALAVATRLSASAGAAARWVGKSAKRELASPAALRRMAAQRRTAAGR